MQIQTQPARARLARIPEGRAGVRETLRLMRGLVRKYKKSLPIRELAVRLARGREQKDWMGEVRSLQTFVRDRIRYIKDVNGVETLHTPLKILQQKSGDCDDKSILLATMLESIGHPTRFIAVGMFPGNFSHVLVETKIGNRWIPLETTEPVDAGWYPDNVTSRMVVHN